MTRIAATETLPNTRSLEGLKLYSGQSLNRRIIRSADPRLASHDDVYTLLNDYDITLVVDLRPRESVDRYGISSMVDYLSYLPLDLSLPPKTFNSIDNLFIPENLVSWGVPLLSSIANTRGGTLIHCGDGWGRTGIACLMIESFMAVTQEETARDWTDSVKDVKRLTETFGGEHGVLSSMRARTLPLKRFLEEPLTSRETQDLLAENMWRAALGARYLRVTLQECGLPRKEMNTLLSKLVS